MLKTWAMFIMANFVVFQVVAAQMQMKQQERSIQEQIQAAVAAGQSSVRICPGTYFQDETTEFDGLGQLEIDASGVTLIMQTPASAVYLSECRDLEFKGLTIDYDPLPTSQGEVIRVDASNQIIDLLVDVGYPYDTWEKADRIGIHDPATGLLKHGAAMNKVEEIEVLPDRVLRLHLVGSAEPIAVGDLLTAAMRKGQKAFRLTCCENMRIEDVTLYASPGYGFQEIECSSNVYENIAVVPGAKPESATRDRLRSSAHDGFHSRRARIGPKVSNSRFISCGDDGMAVNGFWGFVMESTEENRILTAVFSEKYAPGDRLFIGRYEDQLIEERTVDNFELLDLSRKEALAEVARLIPGFESKGRGDGMSLGYLTYSGAPLDLMPKDLIMNRDLNGEGFEFRNNEIRNCNSRAMCIKANGVIAGNQMIHHINPAILVHSATTGSRKESGFVTDLTITNNLIDDCGFWVASEGMYRRTGGICVTTDARAWGAGWHRGIVIRDNVFQNIVRGPNLIVTYSSDVVIDGNLFRNTHASSGSGGTRLGVDAGSVIWLDSVNNVVVRDCRLEDPGPHTNTGNVVSLGEDARNIQLIPEESGGIVFVEEE